MSNHPINEQHIEYYQFLERLRKSGATNMWGATPYLEAAYHISHQEASVILSEWISNYDELNLRFGWQKEISVLYGVQVKGGAYPDLIQFEAPAERHSYGYEVSLWKKTLHEEYVNTGKPYRGHYMFTNEEAAGKLYRYLQQHPDLWLNCPHAKLRTITPLVFEKC